MGWGGTVSQQKNLQIVTTFCTKIYKTAACMSNISMPRQNFFAPDSSIPTCNNPVILLLPIQNSIGGDLSRTGADAELVTGNPVRYDVFQLSVNSCQIETN